MSPWFATETPNSAAVPTIRRSARRARASSAGSARASRDRRLPAEQPERDRDEQRDVERVDVRGHADVPGDRREREAERRRAREQRRRAEAAEHEHGQAGGERGEEAAQQRHPERGLAERREDEVREPAEEDERREPGRVHRPEQRRHGLDLGRVPGADARQHRRAVDDAARSRNVAPATSRRSRRAGAGGYQPSSWPQVTPHRLIRAPATSSTIAVARGRPSPTRPAPRATSGRRNGMKSSENR